MADCAVKKAGLCLEGVSRRSTDHDHFARSTPVAASGAKNVDTYVRAITPLDADPANFSCRGSRSIPSYDNKPFKGLQTLTFQVKEANRSYKLILMVPKNDYTPKEINEIVSFIIQLNQFTRIPVRLFVWNSKIGSSYNPNDHTVTLAQYSLYPHLGPVDDIKMALAHEMGHGIFEKGFANDREWNRIFEFSLGGNHHLIVDDSSYIEGACYDASGHPYDNPTELFASSVQAYFLNADQFVAFIQNPQTAPPMKAFGKLVWSYMRDRLFGGHVFTADGTDPFASENTATLKAELMKIRPDIIRSAFGHRKSRGAMTWVWHQMPAKEKRAIIAQLIENLKNGSEATKCRAIECLMWLGQRGNKQAKLEIAAAQTDPNLEVRGMAQWALTMLGPVAQAKTEQQLRGKHLIRDETVYHLAPDTTYGLYLLASRYQKQGQYKKAERILREAHRSFPTNTTFMEYLGRVLVTQGKLKEAEAIFKEALRFKRSSSIFYSLADIYQKQGKMNKKIRALRKAVRYNPNDAKALADLGSAYATRGHQGDLERALHFTRQALRLERTPATLEILATIYFKQGKLDELIPLFHEIISRDPNNANAYANLGATYAARGQTGDRKLAIRFTTHALRLDPNIQYAKENLETLYFRKTMSSLLK